MNRIAEFHKVSLDRFQHDMEELKHPCVAGGCAREAYMNLKLPQRATSGSAGYDFYSPCEITLLPSETVKIPTGIRVYIEDGWWLGCLPRSSMGFKYRLMLDNTMGVIDSDYFYSDNEGHIFAKVTNNGNKTLYINVGEAFMQGIFLPYGITKDDNATTIRNGGIGSTGA